MATTYKVTRKFTGGILKGLTHTEETTVKFSVGFRCDKPAGGSPYIITEVEPVTGMNEIIAKAKAAGFEDYWSGIETVHSRMSREGMAKAILINYETADVVEVWENGDFDIYNQFGEQTTFTI